MPRPGGGSSSSAAATGPLRWPDPTHIQGGTTDLFGHRKPWRTARDVIDWSTEGTSIFTRRRPLAANTLRRILAGAERFGWPAPHRRALRALLDGQHPALDVQASDAEPLLAASREAHPGLVMATGATGAARPVSEPVPTVTAGGHGGVRPHFIRPLVAPYYGATTMSRPCDEPLNTVTTKARFGLAEPYLIRVAHGDKGNNPSGRVIDINSPLPTLTGSGEFGLVQADTCCGALRIDVLYRMLSNRELARAMGFSDDEVEYEFAGSSADVTRQIGNAVPVHTAAALVGQLVEDMA